MYTSNQTWNFKIEKMQIKKKNAQKKNAQKYNIICRCFLWYCLVTQYFQSSVRTVSGEICLVSAAQKI